jgi:hypothetical protein
MAGDWMKIELELPDKPEVHGISNILNLDPDCVVGKLIRVWQWFDKHTIDGNAHGVTFSLLDRITSVKGFGEAMMFVGWIEQKDKVLCMPKFDRHTSSSAKTRALSNKRVDKLRNSTSVTFALPEKRREENIKNIAPLAMLTAMGISEGLAKDWIKVRKEKKQAITQTALDRIKSHAESNNFTFDKAIKICVEKSWAGFNVKWLDHEYAPSKKDEYL